MGQFWHPASYRVVVDGLPDPGTVTMLWVITTRAPRTSATVSTARMSARMTRRLPVVAGVPVLAAATPAAVVPVRARGGGDGPRPGGR